MALFTLSQAVSLPGIQATVLTNDKITDLAQLTAWATAQLALQQLPAVSYEIGAIDIAKTRQDVEGPLTIGEVVHVIDEGLAVDTQALVREITRDLANPALCTVALENKRRTIAEDIADAVESTTEPEPETQATTDNVFLDGTDPAKPLSDWQDENDASMLDGKNITPESLQKVWMGMVENDTSNGSAQAYTISLLSAVDLTSVGVTLYGVRVVDDTAPHYEIGQIVAVVQQPRQDVGALGFIISGGGPGGGTGETTLILYGEVPG